MSSPPPPGPDTGSPPPGPKFTAAPMSRERRLEVYAAQNGQSHELTHRQHRRAMKKQRRTEDFST